MKPLKTVKADASLYSPQETYGKGWEIWVDCVGEFLTVKQAKRLRDWLTKAIEEAESR